MHLQSETSVFYSLRFSAHGKHLMHFQTETSVFKFFQFSVHGKTLMRFQSESSVFKFLRRTVEGAYVFCLKESDVFGMAGPRFPLPGQ